MNAITMNNEIKGCKRPHLFRPLVRPLPPLHTFLYVVAGHGSGGGLPPTPHFPHSLFLQDTGPVAELRGLLSRWAGGGRKEALVVQALDLAISESASGDHPRPSIRA